MPPEQDCGIFGVSPKWLQRYVTQRCFLVVYGLLGTIQAMSSLYFVVTLTTIEKRFKIPSQTTGELRICLKIQCLHMVSRPVQADYNKRLQYFCVFDIINNRRYFAI